MGRHPAILDRLLHHCEVISINGPSYRLKDHVRPKGVGPGTDLPTGPTDI